METRTTPRNPLINGEMDNQKISQFLRPYEYRDPFNALRYLIQSAIQLNRIKTLGRVLDRMTRYNHPEALDDQGNTVLHLAMRDGSPELVCEMMRHTDFHDRPNNEGIRPFEIAFIHRKRENVKALYKSRLDLCLPGSMSSFCHFSSMILLHLAAREGDNELIEFFLAHNAQWSVDLQTRASGWWTPLHLAAYNAHVSTIELLINRGAALNLRERTENRSALDLVLMNQKKPLNIRYDIAELLVARGADFSAWQDDAAFKENVLSRFGITASDPLHYQYMIMCTMASSGHSEFRHALKKQDEDRFQVNEKSLQTAGWKKLMTSEQLAVEDVNAAEVIDGFCYYGVAYYKVDPNNPEAVNLLIAHRGTCFNKPQNVLTDYQILRKRRPDMLRAAELYYNKLIGLFIDKEWSRSSIFVTHVGFSLGGGIAAAMAIEKRQYLDNAVTFDAPGMDYLLEANGLSPQEIDEVHGRVTNYVMPEPTLINTTNRHVGEVRQCVFGKLVPLKTQFDCDYIALFNERALHHGLSAFNSHDLARIGNQIVYRQLTSWIQADNQVHLGSQPSVPDEYSHFGTSSISAALFSLIAVVAQGAAIGSRFVLWDWTQEVTNTGEKRGLIGVVHARVNTILHTTLSRYESKPNWGEVTINLNRTVKKLISEKKLAEIEYEMESEKLTEKIKNCEANRRAYFRDTRQLHRGYGQEIDDLERALEKNKKKYEKNMAQLEMQLRSATKLYDDIRARVDRSVNSDESKDEATVRVVAHSPEQEFKREEDDSSRPASTSSSPQTQTSRYQTSTGEERSNNSSSRQREEASLNRTLSAIPPSEPSALNRVTQAAQQQEDESSRNSLAQRGAPSNTGLFSRQQIPVHQYQQQKLDVVSKQHLGHRKSNSS